MKTFAARFSSRSLALVTVVTLSATGSIVFGSAESAVAADGSVTGRVFSDYNANGLYDATVTPRSGIAVDTGIPGVTVTAYDANNAVFGSTVVSAADGSYTLAGTGAATSALRVEFTTVPAGYEETPVFSSTGARSGTSVQFVSVGAADVNFGASVPENFSQNNPPVITAIQYAGIPTSTSAGKPALVAQAYSENYLTSGAQGTTFPGRTTLATFQQLGSVWGVAYNAPGNDIYVAASYKRHSGLGTLGLGGIYRVTNAVTNGSISTSGTTVSNWLDVTSLGIDVGTVLSNSDRGLSGGNTEARDPDAFAKAGKVGIGGIAVSPDGKFLYFVNLADKQLYTLDISVASAPTLVAKTSLELTTGERPWAVTVHAGQLLVGYVTTGETSEGGVETANPGISASAAGMTANVISTTLPVSTGSVFTPALTRGDLGYTKGNVYGNALVPQSKQWNTWTDEWTWTRNGGGSVGEADGGWQIYPSPILESLTFDSDNYLTLGFGDRTGIQGGNRNYSALPKGDGHFETGASGDIILAAPDITGTSWGLESAGAAGDRTAAGTPAGRTTNAEGPGGGEFYSDGNNQGNGSIHLEVALGALTTMCGTSEVVATEYDPLDGIRLAGLSWLSTATGAGVGGYEHNTDGGGSISIEGTFQKGGGLGGIQILAEVAPLEIGNRVWFDADQDGQQDADEPALSGVTVQLYQGTTLLGERTTGPDGSYYFSSDARSPFYSAGLKPNGGNYSIIFVKPTGNVVFSAPDATTFGTVPWSSLALTSQNFGSDLTDSDPDAAGKVTYTAGAAGVSDHSIDAGYIANASFTITKQLAAGSGAQLPDQTFSVNSGGVDFRGSPIEAATSSFDLAAGSTSAAVSVPVGTKVTVGEINGGRYRGVTVSPAGATLVTAGTPVKFTVTNDLFESGRFQVTKDVTGPGAALVSGSQSFTVRYSYPGLAAPKTLTVTKGATSALSDPIPYGAEVTVTEAAPTGGPTGVGWNTPSWSQLSGVGAVTSQIDGSAKITIGDAGTLVVGLNNPTTVAPKVTILRGDQVGTTYHAADSIGTAEIYTPGSTRNIVITVSNSGTEPLKNVVVGDSYTSGPQVSDILWTFPDGSTVTAAAGTAVNWPKSFDGSSTWAPGAVITGTATLTIGLSDQPHIATATVKAVGASSNTAVADENDYNAFTGGIQVIKYDGNQADPAIVNGSGAPITPTKAGILDSQDADTPADAVVYPVNVPQTVRLVATNTGTTALTNISLADVTTVGPNVNSGWTADLRSLGGPANFSFAGGARWPGVLRPGETTTLTLDALKTHTGEVTVVGTIVVPALGTDGIPTGEPKLVGGTPVVALVDGAPATVTDADPFNAKTGVGPQIGIQLGDGSGGTIVNDADTMATGEVYQPGETRTVVFTVVNTGTEALRDVVIDDTVLSGAELTGPLVWTFPDGTTATATRVGGKLVVQWPKSFDGTSTWAPGAVITGTAKLSLNAADAPHVNVTTVSARGATSLVPVTASDPYNAFTGAIQVIEYDGELPDPAVKDSAGNWIVPGKPGVQSGQDADNTATAVVYAPGEAKKVRWVISNTGTTAMTQITLNNLVTAGTPVSDDWTADLSPIGGPASYSFARSGPWSGILLPGQSFFAQGTLTLPAGGTHANTVTGAVIVPEVDRAGVPTGRPSIDAEGNIQLATLADGRRFIVSARDPFTAVVAGAGLAYTGTALVMPALIALQLLIAGGVLIFFARRGRLGRSKAV
jgi:SdrD B-like domain/Domain of unknown function (DUF5979)